MQNRAYSILDVKAFDDDKRIFSGIATTPAVDRVGDIIDPMGVKYSNPMPLLHQHDHASPIGHVRFKKPTADGVEFEAQIAKIDEPPALKERVDVAWGEIRHGLVRATSIGFKPVEYSYMDNGGIRYQEVEVYELSTVTIPANAEAVITAVKSIDDAAIARETGRQAAETVAEEIPVPPEPAASGKEVRVVRLNEPLASEPFVIRNIRRT